MSLRHSAMLVPIVLRPTAYRYERSVGGWNGLQSRSGDRLSDRLQRCHQGGSFCRSARIPSTASKHLRQVLKEIYGKEMYTYYRSAQTCPSALGEVSPIREPLRRGSLALVQPTKG